MVSKNRLAATSKKEFHLIVRTVKSTVALLLVALWLPASSHALLQHAGFIHQVHSHDAHDDHHDADSSGSNQHDADNHAAADGLCLASVGKVQMPTPGFAMLPGWFAVPLVAPLMDALSASLHSGLSPPGPAPPELSRRWQFSSRAALPIRAPSLCS